MTREWNIYKAQDCTVVYKLRITINVIDDYLPSVWLEVMVNG